MNATLKIQSLNRARGLSATLLRLTVMLAVLAGAALSQAAVIVKTNNATALNVAGSWTNNAVPGASDIAQWDSVVSDANNTTNTLGATMTWGGIKIINPIAKLQINAGNSLTNGASGIDMTGATVDLALSNTVCIAPGALQQWNVTAGRTLSVLAIPNKTGQPANNTGVLQVGTTGTVRFGSVAATTIADNQGNPWVTYGLSDWAALDSSGNVIAATYTAAPTAMTAGVFNDITGNIAGGAGSAIDIPGIRFNASTAYTVSLANSGTARTFTCRGILMTPNCVGATIGGTPTTSFIRPARSTIANTGWNFIQNSTIGDLTISALLSDGSSSAPAHLVKSGPGNLIISNPGGGHTGGTDINGGTLTVAAGATLGSGTVAVNNTGRLVINASNTTFLARITVNSGGTNSLKINTAGAQQFTSAVNFSGGTTHCEFNFGSGPAPSTTTAPLLVSNVTANGTIALDIFNNNLTLGTYPLIKYTNSLTGTGFGAFALGFMPPHILGYLSNDTVNTSISLVVTNVNQPIHWAVGNANWDINTTANWIDTLGSSTTYQQVTTPYSFIGDSVLFNDSASGSSPITVSLATAVSPATMTANNSSKAYTISGTGSIAGVGSFTKTGSGTLTLATTNSFSGGMILNGGTVIFSTLTNLGSGAITFGGGALQYASGNTEDISVRTVTFGAGGGTINDGGNTVVLANPIGASGAGGLTKSGAGSLTLTGTNRYSGNTVVANGTLALAANTYISNSAAIIVNGGAVLDAATSGIGLTLRGSPAQIVAGTGTINGTVISSNGVITPGTNGVVGTLTFGNDLTIAGTTVINIDLATNTALRDLISVGGNLSLSAGTLNLNVTGTLTNGVYKLIQYTGSLASGGGSSGNLVLAGYTQAGKILALSDANANEIDLVVSSLGGTSTIWNGNYSSAWDIETTPNFTNSSGAEVNFVQGDKPTFNDASGNASVSLMGALQPGSVTVTANANNYVFNDGVGGGAGKLSGAGGITKNGTSTLTIATANNNTGPTVINGGVLQVGNASTIGDLGSGNVTNNAALVFNQTDSHTQSGAISGTGSLTQNGGGTLTLATDNTYSGPTTIASTAAIQVGVGGAAGSLGSGAITNDGALIFNRTGNFITGKIKTGPATGGTVAFNGAATVTFTNGNTYVNNTAISNGVVKLAVSEAIPSVVTVPANTTGALILDGGAISAGVLDLNGFNQTVNALSGVNGTFVGLITNGVATTGTNTLTVLGAASTTYYGTIVENAGGGKISLVVRGANALELRGANAYTGGTIVGDAATLSLHNNAAAAAGGILMSNGTTLKMAAASTGGDPSIFIGNVVTIADNSIATFTTVGAANGFNGTIVGSATATNSFSGSTSVSFGSSGLKQWQSLLGTVLVPTGTGVRFSTSSGVADGGDSATFDVAGGLYGKAAGTISLGALQGSGSINGPGSGTLTYIIGSKNIDTTFSGAINGNGLTSTNTAIVKTGTGKLTLTGTMNYTGSTTISNGIIALGADATVLDASPTINLVATNSEIDVTGQTSQTLALGNSIAQTLTGIGKVTGSISAVAGNPLSIIPGTSGTAGTLTVTGNASLTMVTNVMDFALANTTGNGVNDLLKVNGNLTLAGTVVVRPNFLTGGITFGQPYTIITYLGTLTGDTNNLALDPGAYSHLTYEFSTNTPGAITLTFLGSSNLLWRGDSTNSWQVGTVTNWFDGVSSNYYGQYDTVKFDNTASNFTAVLVGTIMPNGITVNSDSNYVFSGSGKLSGTTSLTKDGTGFLTLSNTTANDFSGSTVVSNGVLNSKNAGALSQFSSLEIKSAGLVQLGGFAATVGGLSGSGAIDNSGAAASILTVGSLGTGVWSGAISNSGAGGINLLLNDTNNLWVSGVNKLNSAAASQINNGLASFIITNSGAVSLNVGEFWMGSQSSATGKVVIAGGSLVVSNWLVVGRGFTNANGTLVVNSGTVQKAGLATTHLVVGSLGATGNLTVNGGQVLNNGNLWVGEGTGAQAVVNLNGGLLQATQVRTNGTAPTSSVINFNGGTLQASAASANFIQGVTANVQNGGLTLDDGGFVLSLPEPLLASGSGGLIKKGAGTVYLDTANTYTGLTIVTNGTLAGIGSLAGAVAVGPLGTLGAGDAAAIGKLTLAGSLNLTGNAAFRISKSGVVLTNDRVAGITAANYGGTLTITTNGSPTAFTAGDTFTLFSASSHTGSFIIVGSPGSGLAYSFANGVLSVVSSGPAIFTSQPGITNLTMNGSNVVIAGTNGQTGAAYYLLMNTNVAQPLSQWKTVATNVLGANGAFTFIGTNVVTAGSDQQFYILSNTNSNH